MKFYPFLSKITIFYYSVQTKKGRSSLSDLPAFQLIIPKFSTFYKNQCFQKFYRLI